MAKRMFLQENDIKAAWKRLFKNNGISSREGKLELCFDATIKDKIAILEIEPKAQLKIRHLVDACKYEIEWYGYSERIGENRWVVHDVFVNPQKVTGASVTTEWDEFEKFESSFDTEIADNLCFHGHSHVDMGAFSSSIDDAYRDKCIKNLGMPRSGEDIYRIFFVTNKSTDVHVEIYDLTNNIIYENKDVEVVTIFDDGEDLYGFLDGAFKNVKRDVEPINKNHTKETSLPRLGEYCGFDSYGNFYRGR